MSLSRSAHQRMLERYFQRLIYLLITISFIMLVTTGQLSAVAIALFTLPLGGAFSAGIQERFRISKTQAGVLTRLYLVFFVADLFFLSRSLVNPTLHLILFVEVVKLYQPKSEKDYYYLSLLSLLKILAASSLSVNLSFLPGFLTYLWVALAVLIGFEIRRMSAKFQEVQPHPGSVRSFSSLPRFAGQGPSAHRQFIRGVAVLSVLAMLGIILTGICLFFSIPRFGLGYLRTGFPRSSALSGFSDRIDLGGIGSIQLDSSVVMRVRVTGDFRSLRRSRWRGVTLDYFDGKRWEKRIKGPIRPFPQERLNALQRPTPGRTLVQYEVLMEPSSNAHLFTVDRVVSLKGRLNSLGLDPLDDSITAGPRAFNRTRYRAASLVPTGDAQASLVTPFPPGLTQGYLQLPALDSRIPELARRVVQNAGSTEEKARLLESHLRASYRYSLDQSSISQPRPLNAFLFETREGHCEYFASAMVVLLRCQGIHARIVNGFQAGRYNAIGGNYIIRGYDAHSWVEAFVPNRGWLTFDPTPASAARSFTGLLFTLRNFVDAVDLFWSEWILGYDDVVQSAFFSSLHQTATGEISRLRRRLFLNSSELLQSLVRAWPGRLASSSRQTWTLAALAALLASCFVLARQWAGRGRRYRPWGRFLNLAKGDRALHLYSDMLQLLSSQGKTKPPHQTPNEFVRSFRDPSTLHRVAEVTRIYSAVRFGHHPVDPAQIRQAYGILRELKQAAKGRRRAKVINGRRTRPGSQSHGSNHHSRAWLETKERHGR